MAFRAARFIGGIAPPGDFSFGHNHFRIGEGGRAFGIQQAIHVIAMEMAHDHARYPGGINAGSKHVGNHAAIGGTWSGDAITAIENHQIATGFKEGNSKGNDQSVLR